MKYIDIIFDTDFMVRLAASGLHIINYGMVSESYLWKHISPLLTILPKMLRWPFLDVIRKYSAKWTRVSFWKSFQMHGTNREDFSVYCRWWSNICDKVMASKSRFGAIFIRFVLQRIFQTTLTQFSVMMHSPTVILRFINSLRWLQGFSWRRKSLKIMHRLPAVLLEASYPEWAFSGTIFFLEFHLRYR